MRRARRAEVRLTRRADARSISAPDTTPELLVVAEFFVQSLTKLFVAHVHNMMLINTMKLLDAYKLHTSVTTASSTPNDSALLSDTVNVPTGKAPPSSPPKLRAHHLGAARAAHDERAARAAAHRRERLLAALQTRRPRYARAQHRRDNH